MGASASRCDAKEQSSLPPAPAAPPLPAEGSGGGGDGSKGSGGGSGGDKSIEEAAAAVSAYGNPGMWENLANEAKRLVFVDTFDGARLDVSKQLSPMMMVNHNVWLGTSMLPGGMKNFYTFTSQVVPEETMALVARMDRNRTLEGRIHLGLSSTENLQVNSKLVCIATPELSENNQLVADVDFSGSDWSGQIKFGTMGGGDVFACNYLQSVTPRFAMGGEAMYVGAQDVSVGR